MCNRFASVILALNKKNGLILKITGMACWSYTNQHFKFHAQNRHHFPRSANTSSIRGVVSSESCAYLCASDDSCSEFSLSLVDKLCTLSRSCMTDTEWALRIYDVHVDTVFTNGKITSKLSHVNSSSE